MNWFKNLWNKWFPPKVEVKPLPKVNPSKPEEKKEEPKKRSPAPWFTGAQKYLGKKESEPAFNKEMSKKWSLFGMNLGTIQESWAAWCGLFVAVSLAGAGVGYQVNGSLARNWGKFGQEISWKTEGIPQGAIVWINHKFDCSSSASNHVAMANGDCTAEDLKKSGATIDLLGGNQSNMVKVSTYKVKEICSVRWPKESEKPGKITKSINCTSGKSGKESTR